MNWSKPPNEQPARHERKDRRRFHVLLALTMVTTTVAGYWHMTMFMDLTSASPRPDGLDIAVGALQFTATLLAILGAHEYGHYWMGNYYEVKTALPRFLPGPTIAGTLGAYLLMEPLKSRDANFDVAAAGPVAGFVVCVPMLWLGVSLSEAVTVEAMSETGLMLGIPALMALMQDMAHGPLQSTHTLALHPIATAGWVGLFATSINLLPAGNLDGGRIAQAVGGRKLGLTIAWATTIAMIAWSYYEPTWRLWSILMAFITIVSQRRGDPRITDAPIDSTRAWTAAGLALIMIASFTARPLG